LNIRFLPQISRAREAATGRSLPLAAHAGLSGTGQRPRWRKAQNRTVL